MSKATMASARYTEGLVLYETLLLLPITHQSRHKILVIAILPILYILAGFAFVLPLFLMYDITYRTARMHLPLLYYVTFQLNNVLVAILCYRLRQSSTYSYRTFLYKTVYCMVYVIPVISLSVVYSSSSLTSISFFINDVLSYHLVHINFFRYSTDSRTNLFVFLVCGIVSFINVYLSAHAFYGILIFTRKP